MSGTKLNPRYTYTEAFYVKQKLQNELNNGLVNATSSLLKRGVNLVLRPGREVEAE